MIKNIYKLWDIYLAYFKYFVRISSYRYSKMQGIYLKLILQIALQTHLWNLIRKEHINYYQTTKATLKVTFCIKVVE